MQDMIITLVHLLSVLYKIKILNAKVFFDDSKMKCEIYVLSQPYISHYTKNKPNRFSHQQ